MNVQVRHQHRKSLAFKLTPKGAVVLLPHGTRQDSTVVQDFIADAIARLPVAEEADGHLDKEDIQHLVDEWQLRLGVKVTRLQIRTMRSKWGSISTAGNLTLAEEVLVLPYELAEYVVVHELLHLKFPDHRKGWRVSMGMYLPDWRQREQRLIAYIVDSAQGTPPSTV